MSNENPNENSNSNPNPANIGTLHTSNPNPSTSTRTNEYSSQTKAGTAKMKFAPKIQPRKKPTEVKPEPTSDPSSGRGRGRGRGDSTRGRGRGRGEVQMTASGPFAMGPSKNAGMGRARSAQASGITVGGNRQAMQKESAQLTGAGKPSRLAGDRGATVKDDPEQYSENEDEGMEIIDIQQVASLDQNAPTSIPKEHYKFDNKKDKKKKHLNKDIKPKVKPDPDGNVDEMKQDEDDDVEQADVEDIAKGGLDLSASEEEDETEDVAYDFTAALDADEDKMLFLQFPKTFPKFSAPPKQANTDKRVSFAGADQEKNQDEDDKEKEKDTKKDQDKKPDTKPDLSKLDQISQDDDAEGEIGELLVYEDGQVRIHLGNGQVYDLNRATQPSFLQNIVSIDHHHRQISVFGEVGLRYSAIPDIDRLIDQMYLEDQEEAAVKTDAGPALLITIHM
ncbi:hypothetical protein E3P86_02725 [Wallemia ichthyophaga]|uniref:DNA-directed RNA polymerase III subunit RPC4 n=1 Tax=Wallemia ichthyophaga TaxID=245174 RepID=A0A4T0J5L5_WALIC|nr:hypothetical protein E3P86_02725 [Wallemia ichthyophaga]